jgi:hypothetical protein
MIKAVGLGSVTLSAAALVELGEVVELGAVEGDEMPVSMEVVPGSVEVPTAEEEGDALAPVAPVADQLGSGVEAGDGGPLG